ncbi:E3 SUMO-protein ligase PIAS2 [Anopheles maculipalpis]|uniref:E3 SUMO-protein ligase PIAS2 n=1 Tax=Anopheles maculipalpis TaxID=1496333 RepID=UPI002158F96E|nr:E3 SUMO-protein ligase PIAS2 [Anopheles maculipalpis]
MRKTRQAAEFSELKELVHQLRVCDLQQLLGENNISRSGRKSDLVDRVLSLVRQNVPVLKHRVRELHRKAQQETQELLTSSTSTAGSSGVNQSLLPQVVLQSVENNSLAVQTLLAAGGHLNLNSGTNGSVGTNAASSSNSSNNNVHGVTNTRTAAGMYQQQYANAVQSDNRVGQVHANGIGVPAYGDYPIYPDVQLKKLAFFDVMATLLKPATLVPSNTTQRVQEGSFYFHLTPQQANEIALNRDISNPNKMEHVVQVQLRFCLLETTCEQEDYFPPNIAVKVNNKACALPNPIPTNKPGVEPKRPPRPVNITPQVKLSPTVANHIAVSWCTEYNRGYAAACYLVRKLTSAQLLQRLKTKGVKAADYTRALIKEKLNEDADSEIATTMLKVSLICPLGKMRMTTPCRSSTCSHLQCFDASLYLQMNERKPTWNCPVCDKPAIYNNLVIDGYFQEVLVSNKLSSEDTEIQLHNDGSWSTRVKQNDSDDGSPSKAVQKVEVISDDVEVITTDPPKPIVSQTSVISTNEPTSTTTSSETVDLTLSDSDEEVPSKRKKTSNRTNGAGSSSNPTSSAAAATGGTGNSSASAGAVVTRSKINEDPSSSVISLDSPSPPSTPNPTHNGSNDVSSTTTPSLAAYHYHHQQESPGGNGGGAGSSEQMSNFQINPLALHR